MKKKEKNHEEMELVVKEQEMVISYQRLEQVLVRCLGMCRVLKIGLVPCRVIPWPSVVLFEGLIYEFLAHPIV